MTQKNGGPTAGISNTRIGRVIQNVRKDNDK